MYIATITGAGDGTAPVVNLSFPFITKDHVKAEVDGVEVGFNWSAATQVTFDAAVPSGAIWRVYRKTPTALLVDFTDGSTLTENDLDLLATQLIYRSQEDDDGVFGANGRIDDLTAATSAEDADIRAVTSAEDAAIRSEFASEDTAIRSEFAAADDVVRADTADLTARAELARDAALAGLDHTVYDSLAEGEAATAAGISFLVDTGLGTFEYRLRTATGSDLLFEYAGSPVRYETVTIRGEMFQMPLYTPVTDVHGAFGQSNAQGRGDSALSPDSIQYEYDDAGNLITLDDPVAGAQTGSAWPAFANQYAASTGRRVAIAGYALTGTALLAATAGEDPQNWSPTGTLRSAALAKLLAAIDGVKAAHDHRVGNVMINWWQGEADAAALDAGVAGVTADAYRDALVELFDYFYAAIPSLVAFNVFRVGGANNGVEAAGWAAIRNAQEQAVLLRPKMRIVYRGATSFRTGGLGYTNGELHYSQAGYNMAGTAGAFGAVSDSPPAVPAPPSVLGVHGFMGTNAASADPSRTDALTLAADTKAIMVGVAAIRITQSNSNATQSVTFNGKNLVLANPARAGSTGTTDTSSEGRADTSWWILTEEAYGAPLGGAVGNLVATQPLATNILSTVVYELDQAPIPEAGPGAVFTASGGAGTTYSVGPNTTPGDGLTLGAPALVLGLIATVGDSALKMTHSWTGLTEDFDNGASSGGRSGSVSAASFTYTDEVVQSPIIATSSSLSGGALATIALRGRVAGEEAF